MDSNKFELMKEYKTLLDSGVITAEEFEVKKKELLGALDDSVAANTMTQNAGSVEVSPAEGEIEIEIEPQETEKVAQEDSAGRKKAGFNKASAAKANARANAKAAKIKKPVYKRWWFWVLIVVIVFGAIGGGSSSDDEDKAKDEATTETVQEDVDNSSETTEDATAEEPEEEKTPLDNAKEMGLWWFQHIDWDNVFKYKSEIHYVMGYACQEVTVEDLKQYGTYVATASADLQNGFGAEFTSTVYIFMDENGVAQHVFYDEADGTSKEIPMDSIPMLSY